MERADVPDEHVLVQLGMTREYGGVEGDMST